MLPPCVEVIDHHLHHAIFSPFFFIILLQDECACAHAKDGDVTIEQFLETKRFLEGFACVEVHCRDEGASRFRTDWNHHAGWPSCTGRRHCPLTVPRMQSKFNFRNGSLAAATTDGDRVPLYPRKLPRLPPRDAAAKRHEQPRLPVLRIARRTAGPGRN